MLSRLQPDNVQSFYYLTLLYLHEQNQKAAAFAFDQYVQKNPRDIQGIALLKQALHGNGYASQSSRLNSAVIKSDPAHKPLR